MLRCSWSVGVNDWRRRQARERELERRCRRSSVVPFQGALPVSIRMRLPPGSTTAPPRERIAESLAEQLLGTISVRRLAQSVLNTVLMRPLARSIRTTCPW